MNDQQNTANDKLEKYTGPDAIDMILAELQGYMINVTATVKAKDQLLQWISDGIGEDDPVGGVHQWPEHKQYRNQLRQEIRKKLGL